MSFIGVSPRKTFYVVASTALDMEDLRPVSRVVISKLSIIQIRGAVGGGNVRFANMEQPAKDLATTLVMPRLVSI